MPSSDAVIAVIPRRRRTIIVVHNNLQFSSSAQSCGFEVMAVWLSIAALWAVVVLGRLSEKESKHIGIVYTDADIVLDVNCS